MTLQSEATLDLTLFKLVIEVLGEISTTHAAKVKARKEYRSHAKMDEIDSTSLEQLAEAHDAYDAWFRSKVQEALDDPKPTTPQAQVMQDAQALSDKKRRA